MISETRRTFLYAASALVMAGVVAGGAHADHVWKIPMMESFSGAAADWGADMFTGVVVAQEMINAKGGIRGHKVEFYKADAPYDDVPQSVTMFKKLARDKDTPLIFDGGATSVIAAVHDLAAENKIPIYAFSSGGVWKLPSFNPWVFRSLPLAHTGLPVILPQAQKKWNIKKAAMIYTHDDEAMVNDRVVYLKEAKKLGIEILELSHKAKETDYSAQLTRAKGFNPDAFFVMQQAFDGGIMVGQARDMGMNQPVIGTLGISNPDYWKLAKGKVGETVLYGFYNPADPRPFVQEFREAYKVKFGKYPTAWAHLTADGAFVTAKILTDSKHPLTRDGIRAAFSETKAVESISGIFGWNGGSGDASRDTLVIVRWDNGELVPIPPNYFN